MAQDIKTTNNKKETTKVVGAYVDINQLGRNIYHLWRVFRHV